MERALASSPPSSAPDWFWSLLDDETGIIERNGIHRSGNLPTPTQSQTEEAFGFKWKRRDTFESEASLARNREWLNARYGDLSEWIDQHGDMPILLDAGCGAGVTATELIGPFLDRIRYVGVDVSEAVDVCADRLAHAPDAAFMQADLCALPFRERSIDIILSEGVLHHTDNTRSALAALTKLLKPAGRIMFYVYRKKGPIREFTDDHIRGKLWAMSPEEAWKALEPLTHLGIALGELGAEIDIPEPIDLLGIPAGKIDVQRLFYWHVAKMFHHPTYSFDEMNHVNFDWYAPANAHRQSADEVRTWCSELGLEVERLVEEEAGITVVARLG